MADGHSQESRGKLSAGWLAPADWLTVHAPVLLPDGRIDVRDQVGFLQWVSALGVEASGEGRDVDEAGFA